MSSFRQGLFSESSRAVLRSHAYQKVGVDACVQRERSEICAITHSTSSLFSEWPHRYSSLLKPLRNSALQILCPVELYPCYRREHISDAKSTLGILSQKLKGRDVVFIPHELKAKEVHVRHLLSNYVCTAGGYKYQRELAVFFFLVAFHRWMT